MRDEIQEAINILSADGTTKTAKLSVAKKIPKPPPEFDLNSLTAYPFPKELYSHIASITVPFEREMFVQQVADIAKTFGKSREFLRLVKAYFQKDKEKNVDVQLMTDFGIKQEQNCGHWIADEFGIKTETAYGEKYAAYNPLYITKILRNLQSDKEKVTLRYKPADSGWNESTFDRSVLSTTSKIMALTDFGIRFTSDNANYLCKYLAELENFNKIPVLHSTSRLGWHNKNTEFFPVSDSEIVLDIENSFSHIIGAMKPQGDKEKYLDFIRETLVGIRKEPLYMILASCASVLVEPLGCLPFMTHLYGQAGRGKTLCSMVAASVWGNPCDGGYMADPKNTATSFEVHLALLNHLPFICDDLNKVAKTGSQDFSQLIYLLCSGSGKQRSNVHLGLEKLKTWKNISITNGEKSITTDASHGGEFLRTIQIEMDDGDIFHDGRHTANFLRNNYGWLGKIFVDHILKHSWQEIKAKHEEYTKWIVEHEGGDRKEGKQIQSMALLMTAAHYLSEALGMGNFLDHEQAFNLIHSIDIVDDQKRAYSHICDMIEQNAAAFINVDPNDFDKKEDKKPYVLWGWKISKRKYLIISKQFNELCQDANVDRKLFVKWCIEQEKIHAYERANGCSNYYINPREQKWGVVFSTY